MTKALVKEIRVPSPIKGEFMYNIPDPPLFVNIFFKILLFYFFRQDLQAILLYISEI